MRAESQTLIAGLLGAVNQWCKREGFGRATVAQLIVEAHERIDGPATTKIHFDRAHLDPHERMRINGEQIFRWLNDATKDTNLLPANFLPSILAALPSDLKLQVLGDLVFPLGVSVHLVADEPVEGDLIHHVQAVMKEDGEAEQALVRLLSNPDQDALKTAHREVSDIVAAGTRAMRALEQKIIPGG
jgi:hypothetical protein